MPLTITFTNATSGAATYVWDFGDGITTTLANPAHVYTGTGVYTVSLTADGPGGSDTLTRTSYITVTPPPLQAAISAQPETVLVEQPIQVTMWVTNTSGMAVDDVQPWLQADGTHLVSGPQPVSATPARPRCWSPGRRATASTPNATACWWPTSAPSR